MPNFRNSRYYSANRSGLRYREWPGIKVAPARRSIFTIAAFLALASIGVGQLALIGTFLGTPLDYSAAHGGPTASQTGDTQYCIQTAATFASGGSAGTSSINRGDGAGTVSLSGQQICTWNDGTAVGGIGRDLGIYKMTVLDMTSAANTTQVVVNTMDAYGASGSPNVPAGWFGKCSSADTSRSDCNWKTMKIASWGGYLILPIMRQNVGALYEGSDSTFIVSPDGGLHWCNPFTFFNHSGSPGCDSSNWSATGDPPACDANAITPLLCLNSAYLDTSHSSMMWKDQSPFNGTSNRMGRVFFIDYCQDNSCTGMPDGADTYLYAFAETGKYGAAVLGRVPKDIVKILDPSQWQWYSQSGYAPNNVGDGTSWTSTLASAVNVFIGAQVVGGTGVSSAQGYTYITGAYLGPVYLCANGGCGYTMITDAQYLGNIPVSIMAMSFPHPWGPYTLGGGFNQGAAYFGFANLLRYSAWAPDSNPYHVRVGAAYVNNITATAESSLFLQTYDLNLAPAALGSSPRGYSNTRFSYAPSAGAIVSRGLQYYFDYFTHRGYTTWPVLGAIDIFHPGPGVAPAAQLIGCYTDAGTACGIPSSSHGIQWDAQGMAITPGPGYNPYMPLRDLNLNSGSGPNYYTAINDPTFTNNGGDTDLSLSMVFKCLDVSLNTNFLFNAGSNASQMYLVLNSGGSISLGWQIAPVVYLVYGSGNNFTNNTWAAFTVTYKSGGTLNPTTAPTRIHLYVNGAEVGGGFGSFPAMTTGVPNVNAGSIMAGFSTAGAGGSFDGTIANVHWYNRVISSGEVASNYQTLKSNLSRRGIPLP